MSNKKRLIKTFSLILAFFLIVFAAYSNQVLKEKPNHLSKNFTYSVRLDSEDNIYDESRNQFSGLKATSSNLNYSVLKEEPNKLIIANTFKVSTIAGEEIISVKRDYAIDKRSQKHTNAENIKEREGNLFAPPGIAPGESYQYWHANYDKQLTMNFVAEESLLGVKVYKYSTEFEVNQTDELSNLDGVPELYDITLKVYLSTWIEPQTGRLVNYSDTAEANFVEKGTKNVVKPWNNFSNRFTQPSVKQQLDIAKEKSENIRLYKYVIPVTLLVMSLLLFSLVWLNFTSISSKLPFVVLVVGSVITLLSYQGVKRGITFNQTAELDRRTDILERSIDSRLKFYNSSLKATQGFKQANANLNKENWQIFTENINLQNKLPGIQGIGYSIRVGDKNKIPEIERKYRQTLDNPTFSVHPVLDDKENHTIVFLEPLDEKNNKAIGFNMASEANRFNAMLLAAKSGTTTISGAITLVQEGETDVQKGFLMYLPQYFSNLPTANSEQRLSALEGYIYSPFRVGDFMNSIINEVGSDLNFKVYSLDEEDKTLIFDSNESGTEKVIKSAQLDIFKSKWIIDYYPSPSAFSSIYAGGGTSVLLAGLSLTILSATVVGLLASAGKRAAKLVEVRTSELKRSEENARKLAGETTATSKSLAESKEALETQNFELKKSKDDLSGLLVNLDAERKKLSEAIAKDEALLKGIGDGLVATDKKGVIILTNPAFEKLLGYSNTEAKGKNINELLKMFDESGNEKKDSAQLIKDCLGGSGESNISNLSNVYFKNKTGELIPVSINVAPILSNKQVLGVVEIFRDISQEKAIDKAKSEFVSLASHQLRTPLTAINWYADMLTAGDAGKLNEEQTKYVQEVRAGSQRMVELVNALLNVSRIDLGTFMIEPEETDLIELCKKIVQDSEPKIFERKQDFEEVYPDSLTKLNIDPQLTRMIIENLVSNAIKYTPTGGKISLKISDTETDIVVAVSDTGYGIPQAQQDKIFSKLFRADNVLAHDTEGTGLGLYIAKSVIDSAGGEIWFESIENKGTTFSIKIPKTGMVAHSGSRRLDS